MLSMWWRWMEAAGKVLCTDGRGGERARGGGEVGSYSLGKKRVIRLPRPGQLCKPPDSETTSALLFGTFLCFAAP